jgi:hypothetical protein
VQAKAAVGDKKQVGLYGGTVMEVDDAQYQDMWSGKWYPPSNPRPPTSAGFPTKEWSTFQSHNAQMGPRAGNHSLRFGAARDQLI